MSGSKAGRKPDNEKKEEPPTSTYECNICFDSANDPVVTMCGHLFCWPCLHQWLDSRFPNPTCPVCKSAVDREKVIPVYSRGSTNKDPRMDAPPRPHGQRSEPTNNANNWFGNTNIQMGFGIGAFPFGFFATTPINPFGPAQEGSTIHHRDDQLLSNIFLFAAILLIIWLILA